MAAVVGLECSILLNYADNKEVGYSVLGMGVALGLGCNVKATKHRKRAAMYLRGK